MPPDYRRTQFQWTGNGHSQLPLADLGKLSLILTCSTPLVQMGERKIFLLFDLDLQPQGHGRPSCQKSGQMVQTGECLQSNGRTDTTKRIIALATRSIICGADDFLQKSYKFIDLHQFILYCTLH